MADMMGNIYTDPSDYRYAPDLAVRPEEYHKKFKDGQRVAPVTWYVYNIPLNLRIAACGSEDQAMEFISHRCSPAEAAAKLYSDICRCGGGGPAWDYIKTGDLIFERCPECKMPMRHDVMVALNKPLTKDFSLDDFLRM